MKNESKSYVEGYRKGRYWKDDYQPGGPYYVKDCRRRDGTPCPDCVAGKIAHEDWHKGFKLGLSRNSGAKI